MMLAFFIAAGTYASIFVLLKLFTWLFGEVSDNDA